MQTVLLSLASQHPSRLRVGEPSLLPGDGAVHHRVFHATRRHHDALGTARQVVAALAVHLPNGWQAIADPSAPFANAQVLAAAERLMRIRDILQSHGDYDWLTASGPVVILNNGVEFAVTYAVMLMALVVLGGGRYTSADWWLARYLRR